MKSESKLTFTACFNNDDTSSSCKTCKFTFQTTTLNTQYCDNGDGTMTLMVEGEQTVTEDIPEGSSFEEVMMVVEANGSTCD